MRARLLKFWESVSTSFWSVPSVIVVASGVLVKVLTELDRRLDADVLGNWYILFTGGKDSSRAILSAIAASSITVLGVIFSITIVALTLASQQYSPRVLRSFMRDRGSQVVMGVLTGIYVFALLLLRTITDTERGDPFIPELAVNVAILYALIGVGAIIYFIHHIASRIQAEAIIVDIARETGPLLARRFPDGIGDPASVPPTEAEGRAVLAAESGYVGIIEGDSLMRVAREAQVLIRIERALGTFVAEGETIATVVPAERCDDRVRDAVAGAVSLSAKRLLRQDVGFGLSMIVDVVVKALSSGINDPATACVGVQHLGALLRRAADEPDAASARCDRDGRALIVAPAIAFADLLSVVFDGIRHYGRSHPTVVAASAAALRRIADGARPEHAAVIRDQARLLAEAIREAGLEPTQLERLTRLCREVADGSAGAASARARACQS